MNEILTIKTEIEQLLNSTRFNGNLSNLINSLARDKKMRIRINEVTSYIDPLHHPTKKVPNVPMSFRVYCILNDILSVENIPKCKCGRIKAFDSMDRGFRLSCGNRSCYQSLPEINKKRQQTTIKNFGSLKKGYENSITMKKKYGTDNCSKLDWVKEKKIETSRKNWGTDYPWQTEEGKRLQKEREKNKKICENCRYWEKEYIDFCKKWHLPSCDNKLAGDSCDRWESKFFS